MVSLFIVIIKGLGNNFNILILFRNYLLDTHYAFSYIRIQLCSKKIKSVTCNVVNVLCDGRDCLN